MCLGMQVVCAISIMLGGLCDATKQMHPPPQTIARKSPVDTNELDKNILELIENIHALSRGDQDTNPTHRSSFHPQPEIRGQPTTRAGASLEGIDFSAYFRVFSGIFAIYKPLLKERFIENLPKSIVCILSGREDCGLEAELTKTVSLVLGKPLLALLSSVRSQTCSAVPPSHEEPPSFLRSYLRMEDATMVEMGAFQEMLLTALSQIPLSEGLVSAVSGMVDMTLPPIVTYLSDFMVTFIQAPMDYVKIALQFGIKVPSINESGQCHQGDLKQLLMWGMSHNVSWSFGTTVLDILLGPAPSSTPDMCNYPGSRCPTPPRGPFSRATDQDAPPDPLSCDRRALARFNDTSCADIVRTGRQSLEPGSASLLTLCQALSALSAAQLERVWSGSCQVVRALATPLLESSACGSAVPPPLDTPLPAPRVARSLSLNQLLCNYGNWSAGGKVDAGLVTLCSENDRQEFVVRVCQEAHVMQHLLSDPNNGWLWRYCANSSPSYMKQHYCRYELWGAEPAVDPAVVKLCWEQDQQRLKTRLCSDFDFFLNLFANPANNWLQPNCTEPPTVPALADQVATVCRYAGWTDPMQVSVDMMSLCIQQDPRGFIDQVCRNATFLAAMLLNPANVWVGEYCAINLSVAPTDPPSFFSIRDWCDYQHWGAGQMEVDPSVVGLCWQHDRQSFTEHVCCNETLFQRLTLDPQNAWLTTVCSEKESAELVSHVCLYADWTRPIIVDMTDLALCAELDPFNFTRLVCANRTVLQNLMANLDNTWLLEHCANQTGGGLGGPGAGGGGDLLGFRPAQQCQYPSWSVVLPGAALLALCWDYDQDNFISSVCPDSALLAQLSREASSLWVATLCATYTNYTSPSSGGGGGGNGSGEWVEPPPCAVRELVRRLNWTCSADFTSACRPGASRTLALQMLLRCGAEALSPRLEGLLPQQGAAAAEQAASVAVLLLVALEERQLTALRVTEHIRPRVLASVVQYLEREQNFDNKRVLLQCFGKVLISLIPTGRDVTSDRFFLIKEYFRIPLDSLRDVLSAVDTTTVREILQYFNRHRDTLQLSAPYLSSMVSVMFQTHLVRDATLFPELAPLLTMVSPADIKALPSLQANPIVVATINTHLALLSLEQKQAFGRWFGRAVGPGNMTGGGLTFVRDTGNLIAYLPFLRFQHLSPAQLLEGLGVLLRNTLSPLQQQFVAHSLIGTFQNLTAVYFHRLGNLSCLAEPEDLLVYRDSEVFSVIQDNIRTCVSHGLQLPSQMISSLFLDSSELQTPASLSPGRLSELAHFLPSLGIDFLQQLSQSQLSSALPALSSVAFSPAQAHVIVDKMAINNLSVPGELERLGSLAGGVKVETLQGLSPATLLSSLPAMAQQPTGLSAAQANALATKLWGEEEVVGRLEKVEPLLSSTPLLSLLPRRKLLMANTSLTHTHTWNTQQAMSLFKEALDIKPKFSPQDFPLLGTVAQGVSCKVVKKLFFSKPSSSSIRSLLAILRNQPVLLHTSLKKCVVEELYQLEDFSELLGDMGAQMALAITVSTIKKFPAYMMDTLRRMIIREPHHFLLLPRTKQILLVDKMIQTLEMNTGVYTEKEFLSLGVMATYVVDEVFVQLDRKFFLENLELIRQLCYSNTKRNLVASILLETSTFGPVQNWTPEILNQVDRFLFFLPKDRLQLIPQALMTLGRIERLFLSHRQWERGEVGSLCIGERDPVERRDLFDKQQFILQYFLGFLKVGRITSSVLVPTCENLRTTTPSAWTTDSLTDMSTSAFSNCLELIGQDPFLTPYQLSVLLTKTKQMYGPVRSFPASVVSRLGRLAPQLSLQELGALNQAELSSTAALGAISTWTNRQLSALFSSLLNSTQLRPGQLTSSTMVAMGHMLCGVNTTDMRSLNAVEFSKAVLWLGRLKLACSEEQLAALVGLLGRSRAFGHISSWGPEVFIEAGALAGLPDMAMSALVKEQIEGLTPLAVSLIPADKFAVVFDQAQISMFSYEQAVAVTAAQRERLSDVQRTALSMVLTPWQNRPLDFRGRSSAQALSPSFLCHLLALLMLLVSLPWPTLSCPTLD